MIKVYLVGGRFDGAIYTWPREPVPHLWVWIDHGVAKMADREPEALRAVYAKPDHYVHDHLVGHHEGEELHHYRLQVV